MKTSDFWRGYDVKSALSRSVKGVLLDFLGAKEAAREVVLDGEAAEEVAAEGGAAEERAEEAAEEASIVVL